MNTTNANITDDFFCDTGYDNERGGLSQDISRLIFENRYRIEVSNLRQEIAELRKLLMEKEFSFKEINDKQAEKEIRDFIIEKKKIGVENIKMISVVEALRLPAYQVEKIINRFIKRGKLSII